MFAKTGRFDSEVSFVFLSLNGSKVAKSWVMHLCHDHRRFGVVLLSARSILRRSHTFSLPDCEPSSSGRSNLPDAQHMCSS